MTSFRHLVSRDWWDYHIVTCGVKAKNHLVELTTTLFGGLLGAKERNSQWEGVSVCRLRLNELCKVVCFVATDPKSHSSAIVVGVNEINCGGNTVFALNTFVVRFNDLAIVKSIKLGFHLLTDWEDGFCLRCLFCGFCQKCFNFGFLVAHVFHFLFCDPFCCGAD